MIVLAILAGIVSLAVAATLARHAYVLRYRDPLESPQLLQLQSQLRQQPADEQIRQEIRRLDLEARRTFFRLRQQMVSGAFLLAAGLAVLVLSAKLAADRLKRPPAPPAATKEDAQRSATHARLATVCVAVLIASAAIVAAVTGPSALPPAPVEQDSPLAQPQPRPYQGPTPEQIARNWPRFRGPGGSGIAASADFPTRWDGAAGDNIAWQTFVPLPGNNSPVVWEGKVFLSGANKASREIYCFDARDGKLLWTHDAGDIPRRAGREPEIWDDTGHAAPTGVTDGKRFYAIFANGDVVCVDFDGRRRWGRNLGTPESVYGYASSLEMHDGKLLVLYDQGGPDDRKSFLYALDALTGKTVYKAPRPVAASWASPVVVRAAGREQVITLAEPWVIAHDPATGGILWRVEGMDSDVAPSPILAGGLVLAVNSNYALLAIRPDGSGDVSKTHVAWQSEENIPDICSPVSDGKRVYMLTTGGLLTCLNLADGKKLWEHEFEDETFHSSLSLIGEKLYLLSTKGVAYFVAADEDFALLGTADLGEPTNCSPAFVNGSIYIRGIDNLYCVRGEAK